jgi:LAO/AO transport system kinase
MNARLISEESESQITQDKREILTLKYWFARRATQPTKALSKCISLTLNCGLTSKEIIESLQTEKRNLELVKCVVGVTGAPGVGKSTLLNLLVNDYQDAGMKVAVLVIDPSSPVSGGAFLGDRIRFDDLDDRKNIYIRSLSSRGTLGGITSYLSGVITLLKIFNFDRILIETVGVGQNEVGIKEIADTTVLLLSANEGDDIQIEKAGILEVCNIFFVNQKRQDSTGKVASFLKQAFTLNNSHNKLIPTIIDGSALSPQSVSSLFQAIEGSLHG